MKNVKQTSESLARFLIMAIILVEWWSVKLQPSADYSPTHQHNTEYLSAYLSVINVIIIRNAHQLRSES